MICPNCKRETQAGFFCHACDIYLANPSVGVNAGLGRRLAAQILDVIAPWVVFFIIGVASCTVGGLGVAVGSAGGRPDQGAGALLGLGSFFGTIFVAFISYLVFGLWFLAQGKTPGKWLVGIGVVDKRDGGNPGLGRMLVREVVGKMASGFFLGVGYFWAIWDPANQAWHDKIAGTLVVRQAELASHAPTTTFEVGVMHMVTPPPSMRASAFSAVAPIASRLLEAHFIFCTECGAKTRQDSRFCAECGAPLT